MKTETAGEMQMEEPASKVVIVPRLIPFRLEPPRAVGVATDHLTADVDVADVDLEPHVRPL